VAIGPPRPVINPPARRRPKPGNRSRLASARADPYSTISRVRLDPVRVARDGVARLQPGREGRSSAPSTAPKRARAPPDPPASAHPDRPKAPPEPPRSPRPEPRRCTLAGDSLTVAREPGHPDATGELRPRARLPPAGAPLGGPDPPRPAPPSVPSRPVRPLRPDPGSTGLVEKSGSRRKIFCRTPPGAWGEATREFGGGPSPKNCKPVALC
jgi:hypothetical protein